MTIRLLNYSDVLAECGDLRHLLLGNGFSISCRPDVFRYGALFEQADFSNAARALSSFKQLSTTNFESVIRSLKSFGPLSIVYAGGVGAKEAQEDALVLREILVRAIARSHPERPHHVHEPEYLSARAFLRGFRSINTLNYDLLLYWALMQDELGGDGIPCDDGFRKPADDHTADYVCWDSDTSKSQNIRYLHGALHLFDTGSELKKFTWANTSVPLIDQIRDALKSDFFPVFVSEGTSVEKVERIRHHDYLAKMYRGFTEIKGSLIVFGHSLDACDDHIFRDRIGLHGKTNSLYVSLHGDPNSSSNQVIIRKAAALPDLRSQRHPLEVKFFDAASAKVWSDLPS